MGVVHASGQDGQNGTGGYGGQGEADWHIAVVHVFSVGRQVDKADVVRQMFLCWAGVQSMRTSGCYGRDKRGWHASASFFCLFVLVVVVCVVLCFVLILTRLHSLMHKHAVHGLEEKFQVQQIALVLLLTITSVLYLHFDDVCFTPMWTV